MTDTFDDDYLLQLFKVALKDIRHLETLIPHLKYSFMPNEETKTVWKAISTEYTLGNKKVPPSLAILKVQFRKEPKILALISQLRNLDEPDEDRVIGALEDFLKQHLFVEGYEEIYSTYVKPGQQNKQAAFEIFKQRAKDFEAFSLSGTSVERVFGDYQTRNSQRAIDALNETVTRLPTPIDGINHFTRGGGEPGEVWCYLGVSGGGKSFNLDQHAVELARRGHQVLLVKAEGTKKQNMDRLDSCWTGTLYYDIKDNNLDSKKLERCYQIVEDIGDGEILVEVFEQFDKVTITQLRTRVIELKKKYPNLKTVIIDYFELIDLGDGKRYGTDTGGEKSRQQALGRAFKNLAVEQGVWVVTATQAAEGSIDESDLDNPNFVMRRRNMGADKDKVRPFDVFITINRTKDEAKKKLCRLYIDKAREHSGGQLVYIHQNLARSRFYDRKATLNKFAAEDDHADIIADEKEAKAQGVKQRRSKSE